MEPLLPSSTPLLAEWLEWLTLLGAVTVCGVLLLRWLRRRDDDDPSLTASTPEAAHAMPSSSRSQTPLTNASILRWAGG